MYKFFFVALFNFFIFCKSSLFASKQARDLNQPLAGQKAQKKEIEKKDLLTENYSEGPYQGLIKEQFYLNDKEEKVTINRYFYDGDSITILDASLQKMVYRRGDEQNLSIIENYDAGGKPISVAEFFLENSICSKKEAELVCKRSLFDSKGNLIEEKFYKDQVDLISLIEKEELPVSETFNNLNEILKAGNYKTIQEYAESYFSSVFFMMAGYHNHPYETGVFGFGEPSEKVRITFINGILNRNCDCIETAQFISKTHGGANVHYIYRPTVGWANDLFDSVPVRLGIISPQAKLLAMRWKELITEMGGVHSGGIIVHYAHSIGASDTWNARTLLSKEEKFMIRVVTLGSPFMIRKDGLHSVVNYVSLRDGVSLFDPIGYVRAYYDDDKEVIFIGNVFEGLPLVDHPLSCENYSAIIGLLGQEFIVNYGKINDE